MVLIVLDVFLVADFLLDSIPWDGFITMKKNTPFGGNSCFFFWVVFVEAPEANLFMSGLNVALAILTMRRASIRSANRQSLCVNEVKNAASVTDGKISLSSLDPGAPTSVPVGKYMQLIQLLGCPVGS